MAPLSDNALVGISVATAVVILAIGLAVTLALSKRQAPPPTTPKPAVPPINPNGQVTPVKTKVCNPTDPASTGLQTCLKTSECSGCKEYTDFSSAYKCVAVAGGNNAVNAEGQLIHPLNVSFLKCKDGQSGDECEVVRYPISTPGSYCLPAYAQTCADATTDSIFVNEAGGKGGQFVCACKPEYQGMFTQTSEGGACDTPLICGGSQPQVEADLKTLKQYSVYVGDDESSNAPRFAKQPVVANRVTSATRTVNCVAKVGTPKTVSEQGAAPYTEAHLAEDADPRCQVELQSNLCVAMIDNGVMTVVRGSGRPGDPLKKRAYPYFYPPVPPALQRCPDGYTGRNTPLSKCTDSQGNTLQMKPPLKACCDNSPEADSDFCSRPDTTNKSNYGDTWHDSVFTEDGEWNGFFTCVKDLTYARVKKGDVEMPVQSTNDAVPGLPWKTVAEYKDAVTDKVVKNVEEVDCFNRHVFRSRNSQQMPTACTKPDCTGYTGVMAADWDGAQDSGLFWQDGKPWFYKDRNSLELPSPTAGGQCTCDGIWYRDGTVETPMMPGYMSQNTTEGNWWQCLPDTCAPHGHLKYDGANDFTRPECVCRDETPLPALPPYQTFISFRPENETPKCVPDPCNPNGVKSSAVIACTLATQDTDCGGVCNLADNRCYYAQPTNSQPCKVDSDCTVSNAATQGWCNQKTSTCMFQDAERNNAYCKSDDHCSNGMCTDVTYITHVDPVTGAKQTVASGKCSGGCVCSQDAVQQPDSTSVLGFTCKKRCDVFPCLNGGTDCKIDPVTGKQSCKCRSGCLSGEQCEKGSLASQLYEFCLPGVSPGQVNSCCEGVCTDTGYTYNCLPPT